MCSVCARNIVTSGLWLAIGHPGHSSLHNFSRTVHANMMVNATARDIPEPPSLASFPRGAGLSISPRKPSLLRVWHFLSSLPVTAVLTLKIERDCLISRQRLLKRVNYVTFIICCAELFRQISCIIFFSCIPAFLNQWLQHPYACCKGDADLTAGHFSVKLPDLGALSWRRGWQVGTCCGLSQQLVIWEGLWYQSAEVWQLAQSKAFHTRNVTRDFFR